ncbi:S41 family peptidase [Flagellimonas sp.]|uniref:S41 family peptidase n=1 Tax=Flagellimonas sp. TaxID=2058762 RepID=UPI003B517EFF
MNQKLILSSLVLVIGLYGNMAGQSIGDKVIIEGKTRDSLTRAEIPYVNIYFQKSNAGTSSNGGGNFSIQISRQNLSDTLVFSAIGYKLLKLSVKEVINRPSQTFFMEVDVMSLDEVTVEAIPAVDIVKRAMRARKNNYMVSPHKLSGIYRITDQEDGAYVRLLEAAVDIYDPDYLKKNSRVVDYLALRQSRDFRTFKWKIDRLNARNVDELLKPDLIKRPTRATHSNGFEKGFFYKLEKYALLDDEEVYVISATKNPVYTWPNYDATFYVRVDDLAILRVDRTYSIGRPNWAKAPNATTNITKDQLILKYKEIDGKLYLNYFLWKLKGTVVDSKSDEMITKFERNEELNIHSVSLEKSEKEPIVWDKDIYGMDIPYNERFWENYPISNTQLFKDVSKELEEKQDLHEQFLTSKAKYEIYDPEKKYRPKVLKEDFLLFQRSLTEAHPSLYRYTRESNFSRYFDTVYQSISKPLTEVEFYRLLTPLVARINCGHTQSLLSEDHYKFYANREFYFPVHTTFTDGKLYVLEDHISYDTLRKGDQILSVNGETILSIKKKLDENLSSDGYIQTFKDKTFGQSFSSLYSIYYGQKDHFALEIKRPNGTLVDLDLPGISWSKYHAKKERHDQSNRYTTINKETAIIKIRRFTDNQDDDFKQWVKNSFTKINENDIENLIIDLRDNGGGRDDYALYLYSFLTETSFEYHKYLECAKDTYSFLSHTDQDSSLNEQMKRIVQKDSLGRFILNKTHPTLGIHKNNSPTFLGKVFFLINGNTFSAAADLAGVARQNKRGVFIGEETGGTAIGNTSNGELILTLPNTGIRVKIPLFKIVNAIYTEENGRGVTPEYKVIYTPKDIIVNRNKELEIVLDLIEKGSSNK